KTIVTSPLQNKIAKSYGVEVRETLTGFKFIADEVGKDPKNYIFGGEESFGYLPIEWVRDKDSLSSGAALAELAEETDLLENLNNLYLKHGVYNDFLYSIKLTPDSPVLARINEKLKLPAQLGNNANGNSQIGKRNIVDVLNLQKEGLEPLSTYYKNLKKTLPSANVLQFKLEPEGFLTIRPSGTEPKIKIYLNLKHREKATLENMETMKKELAAEAKIIQAEFFERLGLHNQE
ncbi:MAG: phospho-sugar mutase, partial [Leptospirales bacterium]